MVGDVVQVNNRRKGNRNDPPKDKTNPAETFARIAKVSTKFGYLAAMLRGGIEEKPSADEKELVNKMKAKIRKSDLSDSEKERLASYLELSERKGDRGAVQWSGEVTKLHLDKDNVYGSEKAIKAEIELMDAYANGKMQDLARKVARTLLPKKDEISKLWLQAINTAMRVDIPENNPTRRESALFYILKDYFYTTYPNAPEHNTKEELAKKIKSRIKTLEAW